MFTARGTLAPPDEVVVVAIDGRSGEQLGLLSLPREWPRSVHGEPVDALARRGASCRRLRRAFLFGIDESPAVRSSLHRRLGPGGQCRLGGAAHRQTAHPSPIRPDATSGWSAGGRRPAVLALAESAAAVSASLPLAQGGRFGPSLLGVQRERRRLADRCRRWLADRRAGRASPHSSTGSGLSIRRRGPCERTADPGRSLRGPGAAALLMRGLRTLFETAPELQGPLRRPMRIRCGARGALRPRRPTLHQFLTVLRHHRDHSLSCGHGDRGSERAARGAGPLRQGGLRRLLRPVRSWTAGSLSHRLHARGRRRSQRGRDRRNNLRQPADQPVTDRNSTISVPQRSCWCSVWSWALSPMRCPFTSAYPRPWS